MKLYWILVIAIFYVNSSNAQIINFPDPNFKSRLVNSFCADFDGDGSPDGDADTNDDGEIQISEAESVLGLYVNFGNSIESIAGIEFFQNLAYLDCNGEKLEELDLTQNLNLVFLDCHSNDLTSLVLPVSSNLEEVYCHFNDLTDIDVSQIPNLRVLKCVFNELPEIDVSSNIQLEYLDCDFNNLTTLIVSQNVKLNRLDFSNNEINSIDLSNNPLIEILDVGFNNLSALDLSNQTELVNFECDFNNIVTLDLSNNPNLFEVRCTNNNLLNLSVKNGNNTGLEVFFARDNPDLTCIEVDDVNFANNQSSWDKDSTATYSEFCVLGGLENEGNNSVVIFPNPTTDLLYIQSNIRFPIINLYSSTGKLIGQYNSTSIDVSKLSSGMYFVQISHEDYSSIQKMIKI